MESSRTASTSSNGSEKSRRRATDYLQIDPSSTFMNTTGRGFAEELPENFLDTISPHPVPPSASSSGTSASTPPDDVPTSSAPQLASLAPMSMSTEQPSSSFSSASLLSYAHVKNEPEYTSSAASLLSPLQVDSRRRESHDFNPSPYIKEEEDLDNAHLLLSGLQQAELDQIAGRDASPSDRASELAGIDALINGGHQHITRTPSPQSGYGADPTPMIQRQLIKNEEDPVVAGNNYTKSGRASFSKSRHNGDRQAIDFEKTPYQRNSRKQKKPLGVLNQPASASTSSIPTSVANNIQVPTTPTVHVAPVARRIYSTQDSNDPLNAEIGEDIYIDTKDLCKRIAFELKNHSIPQAIFAERILCRSQGTLSDLLRNPKPWNKLKSGRETFRRMFNWVAQPLATRLAILDMKTEEVNRASGMSPPTPAQNVRTHRKSTSDNDGGPSSKRPRLVFTDIQKRTLQAIFKETQRPSREMQQTIAEHLRLDLSTVANFFMNARRRSRLGGNVDEPTPYQQVKNVSPPPMVDGQLAEDVHGPLLDTVMNNLYKEDEQRELIERGFGLAPGSGHALDIANGHHEDEDDDDELNDSELAYEEDVDVGDEEDEEEEETANGDLIPPKEEQHIEERAAVIKEEMPDDGEYGATKTAAAGI